MFKKKQKPRKQYYSFEQFERDLKRIVKELTSNGFDFDRIYAVNRGGLILGVRLSHMLGIPLYTNPSRISHKTIIVDEVIDTGQTLGTYRNYFTVCLHWKSQTASFKPKLYCHKTSNYINYWWEKGSLKK